MQSPRKPLKPTTSRFPSHYSSFSSRALGKRKNVCVQTDKKFLLADELFDKNPVLKEKFCYDEEMQKTYFMALDRINIFHRLMNEKLCDNYGESGDSNYETHCFKFPGIPNYMPLFLMLLEKIKGQQFINPPNILNRKGDKANREMQIQNFVGEIIIPEAVPVSEHLSVLDQPSNHKFIAGNTKNYINQVILYARKNNITGKENTLNSDNSDLEENYDKFPNAEQNEDNEVTNNVKRGKEVICVKKEQVYEYYENNSNDHSNRDVGTKNKKVIMDLGKKGIQEELAPSLVEKNEAHIHLSKSNYHIVNIQPQLNLLEYAQKKLERNMNYEPEASRWPRRGKSDLQNQYFNNTVSVRKCVDIRPTTPKKINNMFKQISQANFSEAFNEAPVNYSRNIEIFEDDSDDSVILNDEEFEKINGCYEEPVIQQLKPTIEYNLEKSSPLKLTGKDITKLNEKMLTTIGLFTERGDIRPGIIDILEEQKKAKSKDSRNKQFRVRREWDLQIHLKPKMELKSPSFSSVSTEKSYRSLSAADISYDVEYVKHLAHQTEYK